MSDYGMLQAVTVEPQGTTLTDAVFVADTGLVVESAQDFDSNGGILDLNGTRIQYTSITEGTDPDDPDTINLADPLTINADADDAVSPVIGGQIPEDWYAAVSMGEEGEAALVPIGLDQRPQWAIGEYPDPVPVRVSDDLQTILDAPGRTVLPTAGTPTLARITAYVGVSYDGVDVPGMTEGTTGRSRNHAWDHIDDAISVGVGTVFVVDPSTLKFTITQPGIYAVSWSAYIDDHLADARSTTSIGLRCAPDWTDNAYDAWLRGGDPDGTSACGSFTYYLSQEQIDAGDNTVSFYLTWQDLDASKLNGNYFEAMIQQIVSAAIPTTTTPTEPVPTPDIVIAEAFETGDLGDYLRDFNCPGLTLVYSDGKGIFVADPHTGSQAAELNDGISGGPPSSLQLDAPDGATEAGFFFKVSSAVTYFAGGHVALQVGWKPPGAGAGSSEYVQVNIDPFALTMHSTDSASYDSTVSFALDTWYEINMNADGIWYVTDTSSVLDASSFDPMPAGRVLYASAAGISGSGHGSVVDDFYYRPAPDIE